MEFTLDYLFGLVLAVLGSLQFKTLAGLILADLGLGVAKALKTKTFEWGKIAQFYETNVLPYLLGYVVVFVTVKFVVPPAALQGLGDPISEVGVNLFWAILVGKLGASIGTSFKALIPEEQ